MKQRGWIALSGFLWFAIGVSLIYKGLHFISEALVRVDSFCFRWQHVFGGVQQTATGLIAIGLLIGFFKGRFILSKTVQRVVKRIAALPLPISFMQAYAPSYWFLIGGMVCLGISFRFLPIPIDLRGTIDLAIGSALVNGSMLYFRAVKSLQISHL